MWADTAMGHPTLPAGSETGVPPPPAAEAGSGTVAATGYRYRAGTGTEPVEWQLAEEVPVALVYNRRSHAVMMATPADLEDFGVGFSLAEGVVPRATDIDDLRVERREAGLVVAMDIPSVHAARLIGHRRALEGRSGCGLCGIESLDALALPPPRIADAARNRPDIAPDSIARAFARLSAHQPMNARNHSVHAAAWATPEGTILLAREDVGRHCALDKLIGALARLGLDPATGFAVMTSRCSYELVRKASLIGIPLLATLSAPTALALTLARRTGLTLAAATRGEEAVLFS